MKFDPIGCHPIEDRPLNFIEQINQTWTFAVALAAARQLLALHPSVGGFRLAPGAHASIPLDIMSEAEGQVGAETFAVVSPRNKASSWRTLPRWRCAAPRGNYVQSSDDDFGRLRKSNSVMVAKRQYASQLVDE
jgi:hypothetical protein